MEYPDLPRNLFFTEAKKCFPPLLAVWKRIYGEGVLLLRLGPETQTPTWVRGHSEARAVGWHTFDLVDDTNMLMDEETREYT